MLSAEIRPATLDDLGAINAIYNHYVACSTCTYQEEPEPMEGRVAWFARHGDAHPVAVAVVGGAVVGWASLSPYHPRSAYRRTVENSVYVDPAHQRRGIGRALLLDSLARGAACGHHTVIAGIDTEQAGSIALHRAAGFVQVAHLREVGYKFGRWLDVVYLQRML